MEAELLVQVYIIILSKLLSIQVPHQDLTAYDLVLDSLMTVLPMIMIIDIINFLYVHSESSILAGFFLYSSDRRLSRSRIVPVRSSSSSIVSCAPSRLNVSFMLQWQ